MNLKPMCSLARVLPVLCGAGLRGKELMLFSLDAATGVCETS